MLLYTVRHGDPDYTTDTLTMRKAIPYVEENGNRFLEKLGYKYE